MLGSFFHSGAAHSARGLTAYKDTDAQRSAAPAVKADGHACHRLERPGCACGRGVQVYTCVCVSLCVCVVCSVCVYVCVCVSLRVNVTVAEVV
jgi:hypothetical protein